jgi:hypothetical protein
MWRCPNCGEQHDDGLDVCWQCGSDIAGNRDPGFCRAGSVDTQGQTPDASAVETELLSLELPTLTYLSVPLCIWISLIVVFHDLEALSDRRVPDSPLSPSHMAAYGTLTILIGIPVFFTIVRAAFLCIMRRQIPSSWMVQVLWMLSMFRLPEHFWRTQRWFVPVYYGSIGTHLVAAIAYCAWRLSNVGQAVSDAGS